MRQVSDEHGDEISVDGTCAADLMEEVPPTQATWFTKVGKKSVKFPHVQSLTCH